MTHNVKVINKIVYTISLQKLSSLLEPVTYKKNVRFFILSRARQNSSKNAELHRETFSKSHFQFTTNTSVKG